MRKLILISLVFGLCFSSVVNAKRYVRHARDKKHSAAIEKRIERFKEELGLSEKQTDQLRQALFEHKASIEKMRAEFEKRREKLKNETHAKIISGLNAEQKEKYERLKTKNSNQQDQSGIGSEE